ncbi:MAG: nicotinate phosphoribosyltransferase, partial [Succinatimonas sp.]|nr:nicotinate phosphoribosyltransferase [Succinatimonas sp.]
MQLQQANDGMMMDLYELTMSNGFFASGKAGTRAVFDVFYRHNPDQGGFSIFAGLGQALDWIKSLHFTGRDIDYLKSLKIFRPEFLDYLRDFRFSGDVYAFDEGTIMYPNEPVLSVHASLAECMFLETAVLAMINHQSLIATKARRMVRAAQGRPIADFGARRAHNIDAAYYGARASYIGGLVATSTLEAAEDFGIPASGTMAHSWVMSFDEEYEAFKAYAAEYPDNTLLLIDTYDVMRSGLPNAVKLAHEFLEPMGKRLKGVRIDSGDLAYLSKKIRKVLDKEGLEDAIIVVTNSLDENTISSLLTQGAKVNSFGIGERLITAMSDPILGGVYKMAAIEENGVMVPRIKVSETAEKITNPGIKQVW